MRIIIFISLVLFGCISDKHPEKVNNKKEISDTIDIFRSEVKELGTDGNIYSDNAEVKSWLMENYFNGREIKVDLVQSIKKFYIFRVEIEGEIPNNIPKYYTFISALEKKKSFLLPFDFNQVIKIENEIMFGGIYNYREYDYYFIYTLDSGVLKLIFDSRNFNDESIKIGYYRDDECIEYSPNRLIFSYDGKRSIFFNGTIKEFCKKGYDRDPELKTPITEEKVLIRLDYINKKWVYNIKSKYRFW